MTAQGNWDDVINSVEAEYFVGRKHELGTFRRQLKSTPIRYLVFYIFGQAGVGKTTLLSRYREIAREMGFLVADCDEQQKDVPAVLGRFAHQLAEQGFSLKHLDERYKIYRQKMHEIENDPEAPQGLLALIGRTSIRAAFVVGDLLPGVRKGLEYLPREAIETQASEWATYLGKKLANKDEVALVREPVSILTPLFFEDLNEIAKEQQIFLCFDNFHATRQELQEWLLHLREHRPSQNIRIAIAGQDKPGARWDALRKVTLTLPLDVFTEREAESFLDIYGITEANRRREILDFSGRLPVLMSWLSTPESQDADPTIPTHEIVERFLRWVPGPTLRQAALLAAIVRTFNVDILKLLLNDPSQSTDTQLVFDWLLTMPFVQQRLDGWQYHPVVRRLMLRYQRQRSPHAYQRIHSDLAGFYNTKRYEIGSSTEKEWISEEWRACTLAYVYHFLVTDPAQHWSEIMSLFVVALRERRSFAVEIMQLLNSDDVYDEVSHEQKDIVQLSKQQLEAIENGDLQDGFEMFDKLCAIPGLSSQAKCYVLAYRGDCYRLSKKGEKALSDFEEALNYISDDIWTIARHGQTYLEKGLYLEALADFDRAIALDEKDAWAIGSRGQTYQAMERYAEALADFDRAIALNEKDAWAITRRGETHRLMEHYPEALADFDRAIALDEKDAWAIASRGVTYLLMEHYPEALADFDRAIALDENLDWAIASRGETHRLMEHYPEALADFDRAIALDENLDWAIGRRGETHRLMEHYPEALADFDRAIALDEKDAWAIASRGETHRLMEHYPEALADFDRAIALNEKYAWAIARRGETHRLMEHYPEALADFDRAIALDEKDAWAIGSRGQTYQAMERYAEALADFDRAIALNENLDWAITRRGETHRLMEHYPEALADFDRAIALDEKDAWAIASRGETHRLMEHYPEALADFDRAIALNEKYAWAIGSRGQTYRMMRRYEEALADFNTAIALDENLDWTITERGDIYWLKGKYQEALADFTRAIALNENYTWARLGRGRVYRAMRQYEKSLAEFNQAINLGEEDAWAYGGRGETYRKMRRYEEALIDFNTAIALDENLDWAIGCRGLVYLALGNYEEVLMDFNRAITLKKKYSLYRYYQALAYLGLRKQRDFVEVLRTTIELAQAALSEEPDGLSASFDLALYKLVSGDIQAESEYEQIIEVCQSLPHLHYALDDFLRLQLTNQLAQRVRSKLQTCVAKLSGSSASDSSHLS